MSNSEIDIIRKHVDVKYFFNEKFKFLPSKEKDNIIYAALDHHEKVDGTGYLNKKKGLLISLAGRIVSIADIYDALIRKREYKSMMMPNKAMKQIIDLAYFGKLDNQYVNIFMNSLGIYPTGSIVDTNRGKAVVVDQTKDIYKPIIILLDEEGRGDLNLMKKSKIEIYD